MRAQLYRGGAAIGAPIELGTGVVTIHDDRDRVKVRAGETITIKFTDVDPAHPERAMKALWVAGVVSTEVPK